MEFRHSVLPNGLQVIGELSDAAQSVAFGFFVNCGARDETPRCNGVSHFLEHMVFKGTERHTAEEVNRCFDELGADYNAATGEESTTFYGAVLPEYFPPALELMADILHPSLRTADFETEKQVVLEEIGMYDDQPSFIAYDNAMQLHFTGHGLGQTILGSRETVGSLHADDMRAYHREHYSAGNIVLAVAGRANWDALLEQVAALSGHWPSGQRVRPLAPPALQPRRQVIVREQQQQHVLQMASAPGALHPLRMEADVLASIIGESSSSRLYWELVDAGLADVAEVSYSEFQDAGAWLIYLSSDPDEMPGNLETVQQVLSDIQQQGVNEDELELAKANLAARVVLRSERPMGRLTSLGYDWLARREYRSVADDVERIRRVSVVGIRELITQFPLVVTTSVAVGPLTELAGFR